MNLLKKTSFFVAIFLMAGFFLCFLSCQTKPDSIQKAVKDQKLAFPKKTNKPLEEEIKYFFPKGTYRLSTFNLSYHDEMDGYTYIDTEEIEYEWNIVDLKGKVLNALDIRNHFEKVELDDDSYYRTKFDIEEYRAVKEGYSLRGSTAYYCTKVMPEVLPEDLIFYDNLIARLYDKNGKIIDEYKMRNRVNYGDYKKNPERYRNKMGDFRGRAPYLMSMLKLPPKNEREGLKYRVLRLDKKGKPRPYLYEGAYKYPPLQYYLYEELLPPYSEYSKNWRYSEKMGCYIEGISPNYDPNRIKVINR